MIAGTPELVASLQTQRSTVVQGFLWILLGVVIATVGLNAALLGSLAFTPTALGPNLFLAAIIGVALWLNRRQQFEAAVSLIIAVTLIATLAAVFIAGVAGNAVALFLLFVPMALAGLLLSRTTLYSTAAITIVAILLSAAVQTAGSTPAESGALSEAWLTALQFTLVYAILAFFIDRFGVVLHDALRRSAQHELAQREKEGDLKATQEALLDGQNFNAAIIDNLPGIFYVVDETGAFVQWNRNFSDTTGYQPHEIDELHALDLFEGEDKALVAQGIAHALKHGHATAEATTITKDGQRLPYIIKGARVDIAGRPHLVGFGIDRSEIDAANTRVRELNAELTQRVERLDALRQVDRAINHSLDPAFTLDLVLEQVTQRLQVDAAAILLHEPATQTLRFHAARGFSRATLTGAEVRLGHGLAGRVGLSREAELINGADELTRTFTHAAALEGEGFHACLTGPLIAKGELLGVIQLFHRSPLDPDNDWLDFAKTLATQAAIALDNATMFQSLQRSNTDLRLAYDTTIEGWGRALDLKDEETAGHSQRVTRLTVSLARNLGVPDHELVHLRRGALLHDIGKMGVPDSILLKPGKLTDDEWEAMQRHTTHARDLLAPIPFLRPALDIPYAHHEKWDGSGYPRGLKGEDIPLPARIFAVVDVYDALTSDRPYRDAWSHERALEHIRAGAGTHFDPTVVDAFLELASNRADAAQPPAPTHRQPQA